jgi:D-tyrosyl-tRNA(Tyr) deacylase
MIALIQRVCSAQVTVEGDSIARIGPGLLALIAVERGDGEREASRLLERVLGYRVFSDQAGKMNRSLKDSGGELMLVSQFTLAADTNSGMRPSFTPAASPEQGKHWFDWICQRARAEHGRVATGRFGADMQVSLINDGPVTFWLRVAPT